MSDRAREAVPGERIAEELERVLALPEFSDEPGIVERFLAWLEGLFPELPVADVLFTNVVRVVVVTALALGLAWLVKWLLRRAGEERPARRGAPEAPEDAVGRRVALLRAAADQARLAGDLARALRLDFWALVVGLGRRGDLEVRDSWTNRELLRRGAPRDEVRALLAPLVDELDAKGFGRAPTSAADVDRLEALCDRWLGDLA